MAGSGTAPDLQAILQTLAQFAAPVGSDHSQDKEPVQPDIVDPSPQRLQPVPSTFDPRFRPGSLTPRPQSRSSAVASPKPIDPATITTWQDGLRCVTKIAAQNVQFAATIRRMMADQRKNEMRWYSDRQALKQKQASRSGSAAQAHSILQSLGGVIPSAAVSNAENETSNQAELANFDLGLYAAQVDMEAAMTAEMKGLGVPFFGTERSLVLSEGEDAMAKLPSEHQSKWSPIITEMQLLELRRRMVGHLEDLYRE